MKAILFFSAILYSTITFSQTEATTSDGKKVLLKDDGTWEYAKTDTSKQTGACEDYIEVYTDKMTGESNVGAIKKIILTENSTKGITIYCMLDKSQKTFIMSCKAIGEGCIDDNAKVNLLFKDGTRKEVIASSNFNCKGSVPIYSGGGFGNKTLLELLSTKELETIRISTSRGFIQEDFKEKGNDLLQTIKCLKTHMK